METEDYFLTNSIAEVIIHIEKLPVNGQNYPTSYVLKSDKFLITGRAQVLLTRAFSKLQNLRTIGVRDYNARGRRRDGEDASWRSYGWSSNPPDKRFRYHTDMEPILPLLLYAFGEASTGPERIEMFLRHNPVPDGSFDLSPSFMQSEVVPVLANLKALLLSLDGRVDHYSVAWSDPSNPDSGFRSLRRFLQHTPLLEHIRLNFKHNELSEKYTDALLAWLATSSGPDVNATPTPVQLDHLTTLELGMVNIVPQTLIGLVSKFTKLEAVSLWKVAARGDAGEMKFDSETTWSHCLRKIGQAFHAPENVKAFMIGWAAEGSVLHRPDPVRFAGKINVDGNGQKTFEDVENVVSYRKEVGSNVRTWLDELAEKAFLEKPIESSDSSDDDGDEDNDDDGTADDGSEDGNIDDDASVDTEGAAEE